MEVMDESKWRNLTISLKMFGHLSAREPTSTIVVEKRSDCYWTVQLGRITGCCSRTNITLHIPAVSSDPVSLY